MKAARLIAIALVALATTPVRAQLSAQQPSGHRIDAQAVARSAARFAPGTTPSAASQAMSMHNSASNARWIGAGIGAVALPLAAYVAFHDRDSGNVNTGGLLLIGAIGAVLGFIVGGIVHRD